MLERIEWIRGIGLLHDVDGRALKFSKTQLVYADNGRGKSTLASVLRSVAEGNSAALIDRKTVDGTIPPDVSLAFGRAIVLCVSKTTWFHTALKRRWNSWSVLADTLLFVLTIANRLE